MALILQLLWTHKYNIDKNTESLSTFCAAKINKCVLETNTKLLLMKIQKTNWHKYKVILGENAKIILRQIQTNHNCLKPSVLSALLLLCLLFNFPLTPEKKVLLITNHLTLDADLKEQLDMLVDTSTKLLLVLCTHLCMCTLLQIYILQYCIGICICIYIFNCICTYTCICDCISICITAHHNSRPKIIIR